MIWRKISIQKNQKIGIKNFGKIASETEKKITLTIVFIKKVDLTKLAVHAQVHRLLHYK